MSSEKLLNINFKDFISYCKKYSGKTLETIDQHKPFVFNIATTGFEYIPKKSNKKRSHSFDLIKSVLNSKDIKNKLNGRTYLRVLVKMFNENGKLKIANSPPKGNKNPKKRSTSIDVYDRDIDVKNWVKNEAKGKCESCDSPSIFLDTNNEMFLEVHHVKNLSKGGSDTVFNCIAVCPNCHREFHHGINKKKKRKNIYEKVERLIEE